jgi:DNA helicase TIP49 (TBP-interacting protein)
MSSKPTPKPKKEDIHQSASIPIVSGSSTKKTATSFTGSVSTTTSKALSSGFLLTCDPPAKQFILHLNDTKIADKKFILEDLDATHLLIKGEVREEITRKVEEWMDENVFSTVERVGENFDNS